MTQPKPLFLGSMDETEDLFHIAKALGLPKYQIVDTKAPVMVVSTGLPVVIVPVRALTAVRSIEPDASAIVDMCERFGTNGIMVYTTMTVEDHATVQYEDVCARDRNSRRPRHRECQRGYGRYLVHNGLVEVGPLTEIIIEQGYEIGRPSRILVQWNRMTMRSKR